MDGWIKLYRKILDNDIWKYDQTAWHIFEYLLLCADKKTGKVNKAHSTMVEFLEIPKSTLSRAISRLKKTKMVNTSRNTYYTTYSICNWDKYQYKTQHLTEQTRNTNGTDTEHIQEYKNIRIKKDIYIDILNFYNSISGRQLTSTVAIEPNLDYWLKEYSKEDIKNSLKNFLNDDFWKDKGTLEIFLRRKNPQGEMVDRIGEYKNKTGKKQYYTKVDNKIFNTKEEFNKALSNKEVDYDPSNDKWHICKRT